MSKSKKSRTEYNRYLVWQAKLKPCADCGKTFGTENLMTFDHCRGGEKLFKIGSATTNRTPSALLREMAKCDVVCRRCHDIREGGRRAVVHVFRVLWVLGRDREINGGVGPCRRSKTPSSGVHS